MIDLDALGDISNIDPDTLDFGTCSQDCALIAQTFERGAHATASEAAVFAPFTRQIENTLRFADVAIKSLQSFDVESSLNQKDQEEQIIDNIFNSQTVSAGKPGEDHIIDPKILEKIEECIPCADRVLGLFELTPSVELLKVFTLRLEHTLQELEEMGAIFTNFDTFGDFCALLSFLSSQCIPDLQRIIALLAQILVLESMDLDGILDIVLNLVSSLFMPLIAAITTMLGQFELLVLGPIDCLIDSLREQQRKVKVDKDLRRLLTINVVPENLPEELDIAESSVFSKMRGEAIFSDNYYESQHVSGYGDSIKIEPHYTPAEQAMHQQSLEYQKRINKFAASLEDHPILTAIPSGMGTLITTLEQSRDKIKDKFQFYMKQLSAAAGELHLSDTMYLRKSFRKLKILRLISFVTAVVKAIGDGQAKCFGQDKTPEKEELASFIDKFFSTASPYEFSVDDEGNIQIAETVVESEEEPVLDTTNIRNEELKTKINKTFDTINAPIAISFPCGLKTSSNEADKVLQWMKELDAVD